MKTVSSRDNPTFKALARLVSSSSERKRQGLSLIEGDHLLEAFLDSGERPEEIVVNRAGAEDPRVTRLLERASPAKVTLLGDTLFDALSSLETPSGVITCVRTPAGRKVPPTAPPTSTRRCSWRAKRCCRSSLRFRVSPSTLCLRL